MSPAPRFSLRKTLAAAFVGLAVALSCAFMTGCDGLPIPPRGGNQTGIEVLPVSDKISDENYTYCYDTIKTTGLEAAKSVFTLATLAGEEEIEVSRDLMITEDDMRAAISELRFTPELLCSTGSFSFTLSSPSESGDYYVTELRLSYDCDIEHLAAYREELSQVAAQIVADVVSRDMTPYERALALHDYLVSTCEYDESLQSYSAYDALVNHQGTCQAYSQAYRMLLERVGIACDYASSEEMNHSWNMVCLDGVWYHVDVTWDDPIVIGGTLNEIRHTFFLKSDETMEAHEHYGWVSNHEAPVDFT